MIDEFVLRGNTAILKCLVPSFVTDFVEIEAWLTDDEITYVYDSNATISSGKLSTKLVVARPSTP